MENLTSYIFASMGLALIGWFIWLDKTYPESSPVGNTAYWLVGGYMLIVFVGPKSASRLVNTLIDKYFSGGQEKQ